MIARVYTRANRWYADYTDHTGARIRKAISGVRTEKEAYRILARILDEQDLIRRGEKDPLDNSASVALLLEGFLLHKAASKRYATAVFYRTSLVDTIGHFSTPDGKPWPPKSPTPADGIRQMERSFATGELGIRRVDEITIDRIEQYVEAHRTDLSIRTLNLRIGALKALLTWAKKNGKIKHNPIAEMSWVGKPAKGQRALEVKEVEGLLAASPEPYQTTWLCFLTTGMRKGELTKLRWPQVDFRTDTIRVLSETSKSKRQRDIPMTPALRQRLALLKAESADPEGHVFVNQRGRAWFNNLPQRFAKCLKRAGIDSGDVSLHTLRHTFATQLLLNGANPKVVSELLGHSSITITFDIYGHVFPKDKLKAIECLPYGTNVAQVAEEDAQSVAG